MELNQEDFEEMLASAGTSGDIGKYFAKNCEWNFDSIEERDVAIVRAADRAIELVKTLDEGLVLFKSLAPVDGVVTPEQDTKLFNKTVSLTRSKEDIYSIYMAYVDLDYGENLAYRNHIRKIFDKADELDLEAMVNIRN